MVYLIGPYFTENTVLRNMELAMRQLQNLNLSVETTMQIEKALKALPTLATNIMNHYAITLNYCVTGVQKIPLTYTTLQMRITEPLMWRSSFPHATAIRSGQPSRRCCAWCARAI